MWVPLQAKSFKAIKKAKSAIKAKRGEGKKKNGEKQRDIPAVYPAYSTSSFHLLGHAGQ